MENINKARTSFKEFFGKYSKKQKVVMSSCLAGILIVLTIVILVMTRPDYVVLYSNLELESMSSVTNTLDEMGVKYKIKNKDTILVEKKNADKIMVDMAGKNLPDAKFDFSDLINMNTMFMSDDEKDIAYQYATKNYIAKVLEKIPGIQKAYVNLSVPKTNEFVLQENKQQPKASVFLTLEAGKNLSKESVNGIASLVAAGVEGLTPENVTIHGPNGEVLNEDSANTDFNSILQANNNIEMQERVRKNIEKSLHNFLAPMFGYENISVMASVKLNFDSDATQSKKFSPPVEGEDGGIIRSQQTSNEKVENKPRAIGEPGVDANNEAENQVPNYVTVDEKSGSTYERNEATINYEMNEIVQNVEKAKGQIENITVSVILNKDSLDGGQLSEEKKEQIVNLITTAAGLDTKAVEVFTESFNKDMQKQYEESMANSKTNMYVWIAIGALIVIPLIILLILFLRSKKKKQQIMTEELEARTLEEEKKKQEEIESIELEIKESGKKKSIEELIDKSPEVVVQLLKTWIDNEE